MQVRTIPTVAVCAVLLFTGCSRGAPTQPARNVTPENCRSAKRLLPLLPSTNQMAGQPLIERGCIPDGYQVEASYGSGVESAERYRFTVAVIDNLPTKSAVARNDKELAAQIPNINAAIFHTILDTCASSPGATGRGSFEATVDGTKLCFNADDGTTSWSVLSLRDGLGYTLEFSGPASATSLPPDQLREKLAPLFAQFNSPR